MYKQPSGFRPIRRDELIQKAEHDNYQGKSKPSEPVRCPECAAVFHAGRWQWSPAPAGAQYKLCPACRRIREQFPAGYVALKGDFQLAHEEEIRQLISHVEDREKAEHPLQRIMDVEYTSSGLQVTTTDIHLARGIGEALHHAYHGELAFHYNPDQNLLRVIWSR